LKKVASCTRSGFPSDTKTYGGGWIYGMKNNVVSIGYVTGLDYKDPLIDPHAEFQKFKTHPEIAKILAGGKMIKYGAKTINAGGWNTMPQLYADGVLLVGDCASFLNGQRIKGIHTAMKSGMLAAETIVEARSSQDFSSKTLKHYTKKVEFEAGFTTSFIRCEIFTRVSSRALVGARQRRFAVYDRRLSWGFMPKEHHVAGHERMEMLEEYDYKGDDIEQRYPDLKFDKQLTFDKVTDVYHARSRTTKISRRICTCSTRKSAPTRCAEEYGNPCQRFCPAAVYEMEKRQNRPARA
jgi:electron-transferring-flavoprotein dehydrogenase